MLGEVAVVAAVGAAGFGCAEVIGIEDWRGLGDGGARDAGSGSGGAGGCWSAGPDSLRSPELADLSGLAPELYDPMISPDGSTLRYVARITGDAGMVLRPFSATRPDRSTPFGDAQLVAAWPGLGDVGNVWSDAEGGELVVDDGQRLLVSTRTADGWSTPVPGGSDLDSPAVDRNPTLAADGTRLVFERQDGEPVGVIGTSYRFHEASRASPVVPGEPFGPEAPLALPPTTDADVSFCATLSPDGTRIFFASTHGLVVSEANKGHALTVWYAERETVDAKWGEAVQLPALGSANENTCPASVTADGCELWLVRSDFEGTYEIAVARRAP